MRRPLAAEIQGTHRWTGTWCHPEGRLMSDVISVAVTDSRAAFRAADVVIDYVRRLGASLRVLPSGSPRCRHLRRILPTNYCGVRGGRLSNCLATRTSVEDGQGWTAQ